MKKHYPPSSLFSSTIVLLASYPTWGQESLKKLKPIYAAKTRQVFEGLKLKSSLPSINFSSVKWEYRDAGSIPLPPESPAKSNGVFYIRDVRASSSLSYLTCDLALGLFEEVGGVCHSSWSNMDWRGWTYGLNLDTGAHSVLTNPDRNVPHSTITSNGTWIWVTALQPKVLPQVASCTHMGG